MDSLFPIKIDIPDIDLNTIYQDQGFFGGKRTSICFIISREENESLKIMNGKNKVYNLGKIEKGQKNVYIDYIEIFESGDSTDISIEINNKILFIKDIKLNGEQIFIFNNLLLKDKNKNIRKLNFFSFKEVFEIYYKIHSEKNKNSMKFLSNSIINFCQTNDSDIDFSFFITIFTKKLIRNELKVIEPILMNIKKVGDLTIISKKDLYQIVQDNENILIIKLIYMMLQDVEELLKTIIDNKIAKQILFKYLGKMNYFFGILELYPKYSFLIDISESIKEIKIILKCSKNFCDLIDIINEKKNKISELLKNDKETIMIESYKIKDFYKVFDEKLYSTLNSINVFEKKSKIKLFDMVVGEYLAKPLFNFQSLFEFCNFALILYLRNIINFIEFWELFLNRKILGVVHLENFPKIIFLNALLENYSKIGENKLIKLSFISSIIGSNLEVISKESKMIFLRINWENILEGEIDYADTMRLFDDIFLIMLNSIDSIENFNILFKLIEKMKKNLKI